jgi:hypothetical protein
MHLCVASGFSAELICSAPFACITMGLDQFAITKILDKAPALDPNLHDRDLMHYFDAVERITFCRWRKHPHLHGWMERIWRSRGQHPESEDFNCIELELTEQDILDLLEDVTNGTLKAGAYRTSGFFFGDPCDEDYRDQDLLFCHRALDLIRNGFKVYYDSWW